MVNEHYEPDATEDAVIDVCRREDRVNAPLVVAETDLERAAVNHALRDLATAGWIRKVARGLYEYVEDPRIDSESDTWEGTDTPRDEVPPLGELSGAPPVSDLGDALATWEPSDQVNTERAREAAIEVVAWIASQEAPQERADVIAWAEANDELYYSASTLWEKVAQPALGELRAHGLAEWTANVGWEIVDD
ncbi:MAG: hypothetical protein HQRvContig02_37 [Haloquadratum phage sp.]|nr:MAG: hypothetical protein HQRvContig02_37 [Haloquadratum phage sp.]